MPLFDHCQPWLRMQGLEQREARNGESRGVDEWSVGCLPWDYRSLCCRYQSKWYPACEMFAEGGFFARVLHHSDPSAGGDLRKLAISPLSCPTCLQRPGSGS